MRQGAAWLCALLAGGAWGPALDAQRPDEAPLVVTNLRCEYAHDPVGLDVREPRLSWELTSRDRGVMQTGYELHVAGSPEAVAAGPWIWSSGWVTSAASNQVVYAGPALQSGHTYYWHVRVADNHQHVSAWSGRATWEMGLLEPSDWTARWITPNLDEDPSASNPSPLLRRAFVVNPRKQLARARLYASAMGLYELELNGTRVGDEYFTPGWTSYDFRYQYQTYDVTRALTRGPNGLGARLGDGWYRGRLGFDGGRNKYGQKLALLAELVIQYTDGTTDRLTTDETWKASTGAVRASDIYDGETYDARLADPGWSTAGFDDHAWRGVTVLPPPKATLVGSDGPPVKAIETLTPVKVFTTPAGDTVLDMGQNMVGWVRFRVTAPAGTTIVLRHAEMLDHAGNLYTANLRGAKQKIRYTARGGGEEVYEPHFTFQGFRYVAVSGWPGPVRAEAFTGVVLHSAMRPTGRFETSNPLLNQLEHNILWGQKGNFLGVPTDCPQRDERLGWTGDAEVFAPTASFNFDTDAFYTRWLKDVALDQQDDGAVPNVIPNVTTHTTRQGESASAGWADVATVVPWTVYQAYGDTRILEAQYPSMKAWVDYMRRQAGDTYIWKTGSTFGDWLAFATTNADYPGATTAKDFIETAYFARSTDLVAKSAAVLGKRADAEAYAALAARIREAFVREFVTPNGRLSSDTQTAYALALAFDLVPAALRPAAAARLAQDVRKFKHLTTGFLGTPVLSKALSDAGYLDEAYLLLTRTGYPSWLYPVTQGATTIWERWDGERPDGSFQDVTMNSFNHYAYGAVGDWMYRVVAGLQLDEAAPGYKHLVVAPEPGGGLSFAKASIGSVYGEVASGWTLTGNTLTVTATVPANTTASVRIPHATLADVTEGGEVVAGRPGVTGARQDGTTVVVDVGSGVYTFTSRSRAASGR